MSGADWWEQRVRGDPGVWKIPGSLEGPRFWVETRILGGCPGAWGDPHILGETEVWGDPRGWEDPGVWGGMWGWVDVRVGGGTRDLGGLGDLEGMLMFGGSWGSREPPQHV